MHENNPHSDSERLRRLVACISQAAGMSTELAYRLDDGEEGEGNDLFRRASNIHAHLIGSVMEWEEGGRAEPALPHADSVRVQRACSGALTWIEEPTRAGWWLAWDGRYPSLHFVTDKLAHRKGLWVFHAAFWRTPSEAVAGVWAGPIEPPDAPPEETRQNDHALRPPKEDVRNG